ncbi:hypothetical protein LTR36_010981 [Oleoguttula mirabilis]|uniref:Uncharacterized protein n=1 Tax=Oleoguttula mirabilis TaxID=1507867 RepID=A0AAV9J3M1_9PEZI|nr:hypothetical protein LTR36_010981 [Oleoguttula mirabilis]
MGGFPRLRSAFRRSTTNNLVSRTPSLELGTSTEYGKRDTATAARGVLESHDGGDVGPSLLMASGGEELQRGVQDVEGVTRTWSRTALDCRLPQVFYAIGFGGMTYCVDVITADASKLKNRGLAYAFTSSPYMITACAGAKASENIYYHVSWRWGFGCFAIVLPGVAVPLFFVLISYPRREEKDGAVAREKSGRTVLQGIGYYGRGFDAIGVISFSVGLTVFLLPFTIANSAPDGWASGYIIAMLVVGFVVLALFGLYEAFLAPQLMLNFALLSDRTVIGACPLDATYQISYYCWANYFTSFLHVVDDLSIAQAGYVSNTFDVVSGVLLLIVGLVIRKTGRFKSSSPWGGSAFIIIEQVAILAAVDHQHVAAGLVLLNVSALWEMRWARRFPKALARNLPASALGDPGAIYEDLETQLSYPVGSPARMAMQEAYGYAQTRMLAAGTGLMCLASVWVLLIRNIDVGKVAQVKRRVF